VGAIDSKATNATLESGYSKHKEDRVLRPALRAEVEQYFALAVAPAVRAVPLYSVGFNRAGAHDVSMWTAIPAIAVSRRGARLHDPIRLRTSRARARTRAANTGADCSTAPVAAIA